MALKRFSPLVLLVVYLIASACEVAALEGRLVWEPSPGPVDGYRVYYTPEPLDLKVQDVGASLSCDLGLLDISPGVTYYFAVSAYLGEQESELSEIISAFFPDIDPPGGGDTPVTTTTSAPRTTTTTTAPRVTTTTTVPRVTTTTTAPRVTTTTTVPSATTTVTHDPLLDCIIPYVIRFEAHETTRIFSIYPRQHSAYWYAGIIRYLNGRSWITGFAPASGMATTVEPSTVTVSVSRAGLESGEYRATIPFSSSGVTVTLTVIMAVEEQPVPEVECNEDSDCDDDVFCNGPERCQDGVCLSAGSPCDDTTQICCEAQGVCAEMRRLDALAVPQNLSRPNVRQAYTRMIMLRSDVPVHCGNAPYSVVISGPEQRAHGVTAGDLYSFGRLVFVPLSIDREATPGTWRMRIETAMPDEDAPYFEVLEADFAVE